MLHEPTKDYEVGYRRPPRSYQFKKGKSGNPRGRPKGSISAASHVATALKESMVVQERGLRKTLSKLAVAAKQLVNKAAAGDLRAMKLLLEIMETSEWQSMKVEAQNIENGDSPRERLKARMEQLAANLDRAKGCDGPSAPAASVDT